MPQLLAGESFQGADPCSLVGQEGKSSAALDLLSGCCGKNEVASLITHPSNAAKDADSYPLLAIFHIEHFLLWLKAKRWTIKIQSFQEHLHACIHFQLEAYNACFLLQVCRGYVYLDHGLQLDSVSSKLADAIGQFLHGHAVFIVLPAEILLIQVDFLQVTGLGYNKQTSLFVMSQSQMSQFISIQSWYRSSSVFVVLNLLSHFSLWIQMSDSDGKGKKNPVRAFELRGQESVHRVTKTFMR